MPSKASRIIEYMEKHRFVRTSMVREEFFNAPISCKKYLARMTENKLIQRKRVDRGEYVYYLQWSQKWNHWLNLNTFHYQLKRELSSWQRILYYDFEVSYGAGIADGFYVLKTTIDGKGRKFFLECDNDSNNPFDKIAKYEMLYRTDWKKEWWADPLKRGVVAFPLVVVYTVRPKVIPDSDSIKVCVVEIGDNVLRKIVAKTYSKV